MIWVQWVVGHLHDADYIAFLRRCKRGLARGGALVVKDNTIGDGDTEEGFIVDRQDSSVTRAQRYHRWLFAEAGLTLAVERRCAGVPTDLYPVVMFCLE